MTGSSKAAIAGRIKVVVADDDPFIVSLVADGLRSQGVLVATATTTDQAWDVVSRDQPHALISDLNFGPGESAGPLLNRVHELYPWVGLVVLTSHLSPELAIKDAGSLPDDVVYVVKTQLEGVHDLYNAVVLSISGSDRRAAPDDREAILVTAAQAEVLRMLAEGASTRGIAENRGTSIRAAETMLTRLYEALGLAADDGSNPRVSAVRIWQQGRVAVQAPKGAEH